MQTRYGYDQDILERIWEKIKVEDNCWIWTASINEGGYPVIWIKGLNRYVHIFLYELENGLVELDIGHTHCYNRLCVNPAHKTLQNRSENQLDIDVTATGTIEYFICGHERNDVNSLYWWNNRDRRYDIHCRECNRLRKLK